MWIAVFFRRIRTVDHHPNRGYAAVTLTFDKMEVTLGFEPRKADYKSAVLPIKTMRPKYPYADSNRSRLDENQVS